MKKLLAGALALVMLAAPALAYAETAVGYTDQVNGHPMGIPVTKANPLPVSQATADAQPISSTAGTGNLVSLTGATASSGDFSFSANSQSVVIDTQGYSSASFLITGFGTATLQVAWSDKSTTGFQAGAVRTVGNTGNSADSTTITANGEYVANSGGRYLQISTTAFTSGPIVVTPVLHLTHFPVRSVFSTGGCVYNSAKPTYTNSQTTTCQSDNRGNTRVQGTLSQQAQADGQSNGVVGYFNSQDASANLPLAVYPSRFNGSTWDREFTCPNSATVNVTAGSTTQIVALSGSTIIRACSIAISMSAAGTAGVYTGTGTNCGTGTTALIQDMTLATGTPLSLSAPAGGSIVRSSSGGELCVKAVTGNVTGVITYAQF